MKSAKVFIVFTFLLAFASQISGQNYTYPNELKGFELFKNGKWKSLKPFVSTKEDVEKIFGKDCIDGCDYDKNWRVEVMYIGQCWSYSETEKKMVQRVAEEMLGKYSNLNFYPKKRIKRSQLKLGKQFEKTRVGASHSSPSEWDIYSDSLGLSYEISAENTEDGKYHKDDLFRIIYGWTFSDYEKYESNIKC